MTTEVILLWLSWSAVCRACDPRQVHAVHVFGRSHLFYLLFEFILSDCLVISVSSAALSRGTKQGNLTLN